MVAEIDMYLSDNQPVRITRQSLDQTSELHIQESDIKFRNGDMRTLAEDTGSQAVLLFESRDNCLFLRGLRLREKTWCRFRRRFA